MELNLTGRKEKVWQQIEQWEQEYFLQGDGNSYYSFEKQFINAINNWEPANQQKILNTVDTLIFHTHAIIQNSKYEQESVEKVLDSGRIFNSNIEKIPDMKLLTIDQLRYIANKSLAKQRLIALSQGGATGIGGLFFLAFDLPLMLTINLRSIQMVAMTYGYDVNIPYERMLALKVFHVATLPKTVQKEGWQELLLQLEAYEDEWLLFGEEARYNTTAWLQQPIKQLVKGLILLSLRKKLIKGIPLLGIAVGASVNYFYAKQVSEVAHHFYQKRLLMSENK